MPSPDHFIPPHGGYHGLLACQKSLIVFDATVFFCDRYISKCSRTHDQMVQAARSGKQTEREARRWAAALRCPGAKAEGG